MKPTKRELQTLLERLVNVCHQEGLFRNCTKCHYWDSKNDKCSKFNIRPPTDIIVKGCEEYIEIPF